MSGVTTLIREVHSLDATATPASQLSRIDPRALLLATLAFILTVVSFHRYTVAGLLPLAIFPVLLARWGGIALRPVGFKVLLALPFALMVGVFNPFFDTAPQLELLGHSISGGWLSLTSIVLRATLTVSAALILIACIGMHRLVAALQLLGVPAVLTTQLLLLHRYTLVLAGELGRMNLARELRSPPATTMPLAVYGSLLGHLLLRTLERAQRIHQAMCSRGFDGHLPLQHPSSWQHGDTLFLSGCLATFFVMRSTDLSALLGRWLLAVL